MRCDAISGCAGGGGGGGDARGGTDLQRKLRKKESWDGVKTSEMTL